MNSNYVANALGYHGQPLQKIWDDERGVEDLRRMGLAQPNERGINYSVYMERQKFFTFQERAKRLKMHQFFARKATSLYDREMVSQIMEDAVLAQAKDCLVQQPPYEYFLNLRGDKHNAWVRRMECLKPGDIIFASVVKVASNRLMVKPLCTDEPLHHYLADIPIKAVITHDYWGAVPLDKFGELRIFISNDLIRCEIYNISADVERLNLGMIPTYNKSPNLKLGLCDFSELPKYYSNIYDLNGQPTTTTPAHYEDELNSALEFQNPNYDLLFQLNGLQPHENHTLMDYLKNGFPEADYASELRQKQASQWAFRSVADGIEHFKNGQQVEAFQCLNKALNIDPRNVEGLVARGALYANRRSFLKGLQDFEKALVLNKYHVNARKYMGETLVALGRSHEEENRLPEAMKAYSDCLNILPQHEQARQLLDALQRTTMAPLSSFSSSSGGGGVGDISGGIKNSSSSNLHSSGTNNNNNNGHSSNDSSSSSEDSDDQFEEAPPAPRCHFNQPFYATDQNRSSFDAKKANEFKLDEDDTMSSVRKLIRDASKHKKAKKKDKKKKDRKDKKSKSKSYERDYQKDRDLNPLDMLKKIDFSEAFRLMSGATSKDQLKAQLEKYFEQKHREESPPPAAPTMRKHSYDLMGPSTSRAAAAAKEQKEQHHGIAQPKLSFQIKKRPLQMDKFGLLRMAAPLEAEQHQMQQHKLSRSRSPSNSRSRRSKTSSPRHRGRSKSSSFRHRRRSQSTSPRHSRRGTKSRSRWHTPSPRSRSSSRSRLHRSRRSASRSRYGHSSYSQHRRSRSRSFEQRRRRTPSPFVPRRTPSPSERYRRTPSRSRYRRSRSPQSRSHSRSRSYSPRRRSYQNYSSPPRSSYRPRGRGGGSGRGRFRWYLHDAPITRAMQSPPNSARKAHGSRSPSSTNSRNIDAGPTIEEVDEMIKEAQKERKRDIIHSDKNILKKSENTNAKLINNE